MTLHQDLLQLFIHHENWVVLTLGNEFRGDDHLGILLGDYLNAHPFYRNRVINAFNVPINFLGKIIEKNPDMILVLDAIDINHEPGQIALLDQRALMEIKTGTHFHSLTDLFKLVKKELNKDFLVKILGIQIQSNNLFEDINEDIIGSIKILENIFDKIAKKLI